MIQRKQSLHLLLIVALMVAMLFMPMATMTVGADKAQEAVTTAADGTIIKTTVAASSNIELNVWGLYTDGKLEASLLYVTILTFAIIAVAFITIFLYRRRWLQLRLCFVLGVMLIGMLIFEGIYITKFISLAETQPLAAVKYSIADFFPLLGLVLVVFAYRGVTKDISLLRSLDRIR